MTVQEAAAALRSRRISCLELTDECLGAIERLNPSLNAFITVTADAARERARSLDSELSAGRDRGPLHGIPVAHKDLIDTAGVLTTSGSKLFSDFIPASDAEVVKLLDEAGAVTVGKTGLHELAYGITSGNPHFGAVRNPHDPERIPGGSSGGAAAAVAAGMALFATGTDTGGSIRIPASFCGVAGIKGTYGLVSRSGLKTLGFSLDHIGPLARTVADVELALAAMAAKPLRAPQNLSGLRVGIPSNFYFDACDAEVQESVESAARSCTRFGATVERVRVPDIDGLNTVARLLLLVEAAAANSPYLSRREEIGDDVLALLDQGRQVTGVDYVNAQRLRTVYQRQFRELFGRIDALFVPATPITAPKIGQRTVTLSGQEYDTRLLTTRTVRAINALGIPALSMPCGTDGAGLPIGLQIIGRPFEDRLLLEVGKALENMGRPAPPAIKT